MTVFTDEGQQCFTKFGGLDIIESPLDIQLCEISESPESVEDFSDEREWVSLFLRDLVECLVVNDRPEFVIFLFEEKWRSPGGVSLVNVSSSQIFVDPFPEFRTVGSWHRVELGLMRNGSFH